MENIATLRQDIKRLIVEALKLDIPPEAIGDEQALSGPASLGLDSVDILILAVAIEKTYQFRIAGPEAARQMFQNVTTITAAVAKNRDGPQADR
jgi:acyl carrier protein